jgi:hypothetical protein
METSIDEGSMSLEPNMSEHELTVEPTELRDEDTGQIATPPPDPDDFTSDAPLVEAYGNIKTIWPDDCDNELPKLDDKKQTRYIESALLEDTITMYHFPTALATRKANGAQTFQRRARANA